MNKIVQFAVAITLPLIASAHADTTIDPANRYAWGANIGFTDWRPSTADGVSVGPNFCSGFIYTANVGWIKMGTGMPAHGTSYSNDSPSDFGVNCSVGPAGEKNLRGFAYGANIGWVNFEATGNPRVIVATGQLRGYIWSANCGWINLDDGNVFVATTPEPSATPSPTPAATATPATTATPTATATATPAATATATPNATATPVTSATPAPSPTPTISPTPNSHLANISTRMRVEPGDDVLIAGFIIEGGANKRILIRGIGPSLAGFGITDPLPDSTLELYADGAGQVAANDNWPDSVNAAEIVTTGLAPLDPHESALLLSVAPGSYTVILRGTAGSTGVGLVELYDLDADGPSKVANIATRGFVLTDAEVMIAGFIITGNETAQLVLRGIGPSLGDFGVRDLLLNPLLELHDSNGALIQANNDWRDTQEIALQRTGLAPRNDLESAILVSVPPGNYTAILKGVDDSIGNGLVEVYNLSP